MKYEIEIEVPNGWEPVAFRTIEKGDHFISSSGTLVKDFNGGYSEPRMIVKRIPLDEFWENRKQARKSVRHLSEKSAIKAATGNNGWTTYHVKEVRSSE